MTPKRLLIVEDSRSINRYLSEYLLELGFLIRSVFSLKEAMEAMREESFDYGIFDLTLLMETLERWSLGRFANPR